KERRGISLAKVSRARFDGIADQPNGSRAVCERADGPGSVVVELLQAGGCVKGFLDFILVVILPRVRHGGKLVIIKSNSLVRVGATINAPSVERRSPRHRFPRHGTPAVALEHGLANALLNDVGQLMRQQAA